MYFNVTSNVYWVPNMYLHTKYSIQSQVFKFNFSMYLPNYFVFNSINEMN